MKKRFGSLAVKVNLLIMALILVTSLLMLASSEAAFQRAVFGSHARVLKEAAVTAFNDLKELHIRAIKIKKIFDCDCRSSLSSRSYSKASRRNYFTVDSDIHTTKREAS